MLRHRLITGTLLSFVLIVLLYFDNQIGGLTCDCGISLHPGLLIAILAMLTAPIVAIEFTAMAHGAGIRCSTLILIITMEAWLAAIYFTPSSILVTDAIALLSTILVGSTALSVLALTKNKDIKGAIAGAMYTVATASYIAVGFGLFLLLRRDHSAWWIVGVIAIVKMCDTGAFFFGCNFGRHKLIPWVSPAKTWEGLFGGLATASLTAVGLAAANNHWLLDEPTISLTLAVFLGILFGLLGQAGDLIMSVFKRDSGVKDASSILPGLGGILDVVDSLILVSLVAYWLLPSV